MTNIKLNLQVLSESKAPRTCRPPEFTLKDRVEYAIFCIETDHREKEKSIQFLQGLYNKLNRMPRLTDQALQLLELVKPALSDYGMTFEGRDDD